MSNEEVESPCITHKKTIMRLSNKIDELEKRIIDVLAASQESSMSNSVGLQNVYNEFQQLISGTLLASTQQKMQKMQAELYEFKRELMNDMKLVKKCYKIMPTISKIKEFDDDSFDRLVKVLQLMN